MLGCEMAGWKVRRMEYGGARARPQTLAVQHLPRPGASPGRARRLAKASGRTRTPAHLSSSGLAGASALGSCSKPLARHRVVPTPRSPMCAVCVCACARALKCVLVCAVGVAEGCLCCAVLCVHESAFAAARDLWLVLPLNLSDLIERLIEYRVCVI